MNAYFRSLAAAALLGAAATTLPAANIFVEAESFASAGGWTLDTQFIEIMGSPYLLAHGMGRPVKDAETKVTFTEAGTYRIYARTKDWVAHWKAPGAPGKFQVVLDGKPVAHTFGTTGAEWFWESGGTVEIPSAGTHTTRPVSTWERVSIASRRTWSPVPCAVARIQVASAMASAR